MTLISILQVQRRQFFPLAIGLHHDRDLVFFTLIIVINIQKARKKLTLPTISFTALAGVFKTDTTLTHVCLYKLNQKDMS